MSNLNQTVDVSHLEPFDHDGALREAAENVNHSSRRAFLRSSGALVGAGALYAALPGAAFAAGGIPKGDIAILNYALTLEYLEAAFYAEALKKGALTGATGRFAKVVADHEAQHVTALKKTLGAKAVKKPTFNFQGTTGSQATFQKTAILLEDTGVKAYQGQATNIKTPAILRAAISIHPVEARHASWIRNISGQPPAPDAFNPAADMATILAAVQGTNFISTTGGSASAGSSVSGKPSVTG